MTCLFCDNNKDFNTIEHIIPESLGNDDLLLTNEVCDKCQNYFSQVENYVLNKTPIGFWRTLLVIKTKHKKLPFVDFSKTVDKGALPDFHKNHDDFGLEAYPDFTVELKVPKDISEYYNEKGIYQLKFVLTPKVIHEIGRFLAKIGLELLCTGNREYPREAEFDLIRKYARHGSLKQLWPIFHSVNGSIEDLFKYEILDNKDIKEDIVCYSYSLKSIDKFLIFNFNIGTDCWYVCLNDMYPHPIIRDGYPDQKIDLIWYNKEEWK